MSAFTVNPWKANQIFSGLPTQLDAGVQSDESTCIGRGGSSICTVGDYVLVFGGVSRTQIHFSDMWVIERAKLTGRPQDEKFARLVSSQYMSVGENPLFVLMP